MDYTAENLAPTVSDISVDGTPYGAENWTSIMAGPSDPDGYKVCAGNQLLPMTAGMLHEVIIDAETVQDAQNDPVLFDLHSRYRTAP